jgi:ribose transport system substrate-binding protein
MKKILALLLTLTLLIGVLTGCGTSSSQAPSEQNVEQNAETETPKKDKVVLGVVLIDMTNQFFVDMIEGGNKAAEDYGCEVIWKSADGSFDNQISLIENFIEQGVDCILVDPLDSEGLRPTIEKASAAGIPTITMAGKVDVDTNYTTVYNDLENTRIVAEMTAKMIDEEGTVALLYGNKGNLVSDLRQQGYHEGMSKYPNINIVEQPTNWDPPTGMKAAQDIIAANPDLKALHCVSDAVTLAAYQAIKTAGKEDQIIVTSYDGNEDAIKAVEAGQFACTVLTGAKKTGYWNIQIGYMLANGIRPKEHILNLDTHLVLTDENKAKFEEWKIADNVSIISPTEALKRTEMYREELYDPNILNK